MLHLQLPHGALAWLGGLERLLALRLQGTGDLSSENGAIYAGCVV